jgi:hypothetical protein
MVKPDGSSGIGDKDENKMHFTAFGPCGISRIINFSASNQF